MLCLCNPRAFSKAKPYTLVSEECWKYETSRALNLDFDWAREQAKKKIDKRERKMHLILPPLLRGCGEPELLRDLRAITVRLGWSKHKPGT